MHGVHGLRNLSVAAAIFVVVGVAPLPGVAEPASLTIVHVNDWDRMAGRDGRGGAARIAGGSTPLAMKYPCASKDLRSSSVSR